MAKKINIGSYKGGEPKKSSSSANPVMVKTASMNKSKRKSYKAYRGQGRWRKKIKRKFIKLCVGILFNFGYVLL